MDHRRKHTAHRYLAEFDHEIGDHAKVSSGHAPGSHRRSRLSTVALLSLSLVVLFVGIVTLFHFSHVNKLASMPIKGADKKTVVLRRSDREGRPDSRAVGTAAADGNPQEGGVGDDDDDGAANDQPGDEGDGDDDGSGNDEPIDKGEKDDDGSGNDEPIDKGEKDDDGSGNDPPIDKGEKDDDGSGNDEPIDKGEKDDDGSGNDPPIDKGEKDDDGSGNDEPIDKGEKDDDGSGNDQAVDKGDKDDDGAANDEPVDKGDKDEEEAEGDMLSGATAGDGDSDDDGTQNDAPGNLDEDDDTEAVTRNVTTGATGGGGSGKAGNTTAKAGGSGSGATVAVAGTAPNGDIAHEEDSADPEAVDGITDYDDDGWDDLYVNVESGAEAEDYDGNQDLELDPVQKLLRDKHQQNTQEEEQNQGEQQQEKKKQKSNPTTGVAAPHPTAAAAQGADSGCGYLSRELLSKWAQNNTVLLTFTNSIMFRNFGATWLYHVRKAGIKYWVLAVADKKTATMVRSAGADHCFLVHENEIDDTAAAFKWGSRSWQLHTWQKVLTVRHVHHLGFNVINSDLDVVWLRNPLEHFLVKYPAPEYWVSMDPITTANPLGDDGPEVGVSTHHYMNTGVYFLRQTPGGRALIDKWYEIRGQMQQSGYHDQDGLYQYLKDSGQDVDHVTRVTKVVDGKTKLAQLPATLFQNGYSHCINQIHKVHGLKPFEVHFVWVWSGNSGKINRMREQMYYIDPPSYYSDGSFLSFDLEPIETPPGFNNWTDTEAMVQTHLTSLDSQLTDTWHGLALAALLQRIVILPKMKCFCIQNWFENPQCRLPGEPHTRFPLSPACPADYVFNIDALKTFNLSGRHVDFREFSFLDNERTPAEVKDRPLVVVASAGVTTASRNGDTLTIPAGLKSGPLLAVLEPFLKLQTVGTSEASRKQKPPKRLHFRNPRLAFGGWSDPQEGQEFELHVKTLPVRWCCRPDAVAKQHGVEVHHQLKMHQALPGAKGAASGGSASSRGRSRERLRLLSFN